MRNPKGGKLVVKDQCRCLRIIFMALLTELLKRQWQRVEEWKRSDILSYCEEVTVARITHMDEEDKVCDCILLYEDSEIY